MIGIISSLIAGIMLKSYFMLSAPLVYLFSRKNRDLGLIAYFFYVLYIGEQVESSSVYSYRGLMTALIFALSSILLLNDVLSREAQMGKLEALTAVLIVFGLLVPEAFMAGAIFYFLAKFKLDLPIILLLSGMVLLFALLKDQLDILGGTSNQVMLLASFGVLTTVLTLLRRSLKKTEFQLF